ncbi:MAG: tetratricopeptide repeat protein, partial [Candidatus Delongbacteria bacterium]|nr:tetratricopeptide repeat protein [Candidatus Delongbacteria bacterium]
MKPKILILTLILSTLLLSGDATYEIKKNTSFAVTKYKQKKYRSAMNYFEKVLKLDPEFKVVPVSILDKQARCYKELGLNDSAMIAYEKLNKLDPSNEIAQKNLEYKHLKNLDFSKAAELSVKLAKDHPDEPEHWRNAGDYLFRENDLKKNMNNILKYYHNYFKKKYDDETIKKIIYLSKVKLTEDQSE